MTDVQARRAGHLPLASVDAIAVQRLLPNLAILTVAVVPAAWNATGGRVDADHDGVRYTVTVTLGILAASTPSVRHDRPQFTHTSA